MKSLANFLLTLLFFAPFDSFGSEAPLASIRLVTDFLHGVSVKDPYRYFEEPGNVEVDQWARAQSAVAMDFLKELPGRDAYYERLIGMESEFGAEVYYISVGLSGTSYYLRREVGDSLAKLYMLKPGKEPAVILDPASLGSNKQPASIRHYSVSPDEAFLAAGIDAGGSENASMFVIDLKTGNQVGEALPRARWKSAFWLPDSSGFFFNQLQYVGPDGDPQQRFQKSQVYLLIRQ